MKFNYDTLKAFQVFSKYYFPLWQRAGFTWDMFPDLDIYININPSGGQGFTNANREHYSPDEPYVYTTMQTREEIENLGKDYGIYIDFDVIIKGLPSSIFHEIGHHIHYKFGTMKDSPFWEKAQELSGGRIGRDFKEQTKGGYWKIQAHEDFANYFDSIIKGKVQNEVFMDWIAELMGVERMKVIELTIGSDEVLVNGVKTKIDVEPIIHKDRTMVPIRFIAEELGYEVKYDKKTQKVTIRG